MMSSGHAPLRQVAFANEDPSRANCGCAAMPVSVSGDGNCRRFDGYGSARLMLLRDLRLLASCEAVRPRCEMDRSVRRWPT